METQTPLLTFVLNGEERTVDQPNPRQTLLDYLRSSEVSLTGTKYSCGEGGCGVCTVTLAFPEPADAALDQWGGKVGSVDGKPVVERVVNACLVPLCAVHGMTVTTIEGLDDVDGRPHPIGRMLAAKNGSQCGYCSPGWVMSMHALLSRDHQPSRQTIEDNFDGHVCRCTGYRAILDSMQSFAVDSSATVVTDTGNRLGLSRKVVLLEKPLTSTTFALGRDLWQRAMSLSELRTALKTAAGKDGGQKIGPRRRIQIVAGNSGAALTKLPDLSPCHFIDITHIPELARVEETEIGGKKGLQIGAAVVLARLIAELRTHASRQSGANKERFYRLAAYLRRAANTQVRSRATIGGHLAMYLGHKQKPAATPFLSDILPWLAALDAVVLVLKDGKEQRHRIGDFLASELPALDSSTPGPVILAVWLPHAAGKEIFGVDRIARRPQNAKPLVSAAWRLTLDRAGKRIDDLRLIYCGLDVGPLDIPWSKSELGQLSLAALQSCGPDSPALAFLSSVMGQLRFSIMNGDEVSANERRGMAQDLFARFVHQGFATGPGWTRPVSRGDASPSHDHDDKPVGEAMPKMKAELQTSGRALYTADLSGPSGTLTAVYVTSRRRFGPFLFKHRTDDMQQMIVDSVPGVVGLLTAFDIDDSRNAYRDEKLLVADKVACFGEPIALVVARNLQSARQGAECVQGCITYRDDGSTPFCTIEEAENGHSTHGKERIIERPSQPKERAAQGCNKTAVKGSMRTGEQAHFYMEPQAVLAVPNDDGGITITASSQHLASVQDTVAAALGLPRHKVRAKAMRLGGGFGGKETRTQPIAAVAALAARKFRRPIRLVLDRDADTTIVGYRHPFLGSYSASYDAHGRIHELDLTFKSDGGHTKDVTQHVMDLAVLSADGAYGIDNFKVKGTCFKTNTMSRTAIRTFGVTQCSLIRETAIEHIAHELDMLPEDVRRLNFYPDADSGKRGVTPYGQPLDHCIINKVWRQLEETADFRKRVDNVNSFNRENAWRKRGISMIPIKYGVAYTYLPYNQGSAYVAVHADDGSVSLHTGAIEMGQGVHTKLCQIAAEYLGAPIELIDISENSTDVIPNASSSGASTGADLNGGAVRKACEALHRRLVTLLDKLQREGKAKEKWLGAHKWRTAKGWRERWPEIVALAYNNRVDLAEQAHYKSPRITGFDFKSSTGTPFLYFTYSAACSEVEIDVLTGEFNVVRSDILYDAGRSLNPLIDIGQVEGGFIQGLGNVTTEQVYYDDTGAPLSSNFWNYKPPCSKTIPVEFNTSIYQYDTAKLEDDPHMPFAIGRSKSTGEPPAVLANSVFFAIRHAVAAARGDRGCKEWFAFDSPATILQIRRACRDISSEAETVGDAGDASSQLAEDEVLEENRTRVAVGVV